VLPITAAGDVIVVTANYRIGQLGYRYLTELGVKNLGVRDQSVGLAWVKRKIARFGGTPTVGSHSAGVFLFPPP
jgi:para-nitrobenzyl esterase